MQPPTQQTLVVASQNPVKLGAAADGFQQMFPDASFGVQGVRVPSGVADQPMTDEATLKGATNRAQAARQHYPTADYVVGIEGGCAELYGDLSVFAWIVVGNKSGQWGRGRTATFYLPQEVTRLVRGGLELGAADDQVFGQKNSKQANGSVGLLTGDLITRQSYYTPAVVLALIPFTNPRLTFPSPGS